MNGISYVGNEQFFSENKILIIIANRKDIEIKANTRIFELKESDCKGSSLNSEFGWLFIVFFDFQQIII